MRLSTSWVVKLFQFYNNNLKALTQTGDFRGFNFSLKFC